MSLIIKHNHGFFSCCSVRLHHIVDFYNKHKCLPKKVDSSSQFGWYKKTQETRDITFEYFDNYEREPFSFDYKDHVPYTHYHQYIDYRQLKLDSILPFIQKYFSPSHRVSEIIREMEEKYNLCDRYKNICVLFYRGNDKVTETALASYQDFIDQAYKIKEKNPDVQFLIQSDETEFIETMLREFPGSFYFKDEIRHIRKSCTTLDHVMKDNILHYSLHYLAITMIMAKCGFVVCGSGNCSIWIVFFRGHVQGIHQFCNNTFL